MRAPGDPVGLAVSVRRGRRGSLRLRLDRIWTFEPVMGFAAFRRSTLLGVGRRGAGLDDDVVDDVGSHFLLKAGALWVDMGKAVG